MNSDFSAVRSDAIRTMLVSAATPTRRAPRVLASIGLVALGLTVGASVSAAAISLNVSEQPTRIDGSGVQAPAGVTPGAPIVSVLGSPTSHTTQGDADIALADLPAGATHVRVSITCLTAGITSWGPDPSGNNPSIACTDADLANTADAAYFDFPIDESTMLLYVRANDDVETVITCQFLNYVETAWGVNANGETFGASKDDVGSPDLVAVSVVNPSGEYVKAYSRHTDLEAFGPDWPGQPSNPTEALEWQTQRDQKYPNGWDVPAYESDGVTQVGVFHIGG